MEIWNSVVREGIAFPQLEELTEDMADDFFCSQSYTGIAVEEETSEVVGLYILHPNNVGRCGHICNTSYAVKEGKRGLHIGEQLVILDDFFKFSLIISISFAIFARAEAFRTLSPGAAFSIWTPAVFVLNPVATATPSLPISIVPTTATPFILLYTSNARPDDVSYLGLGTMSS